MKILAACEESQALTIELRRLGHEAYSCDIIPCSGGHPEWHIMQDVLPLLNGNCEFDTTDGVHHQIIGRWDMIIAFPPCTKTTNAGAKHLWRGHVLNIPRYFEGLCGKALFEAIRHADCDKIAIENPTPSAIFEYPEPSQAIQPYEHGHPWSKKTLLWLKDLPLLVPTDIVKPKVNCHEAGTWFMKGGKERQKNRSKLCHGFAVAMAEQWAGKAEVLT
ncbi:DNA cytosine methyltransferase [Oscillibacter sp.]|uniref:DNA cytosine methyltransferase n=1 Tax=Oscillibacter sp. TaxID=1945593 RepID=UPI00289AC904|nr:DNA cytosine methyltransferase [Oscillibacter sp.]